MTTPLQKAAQAVIDRWDSPLWKDQPHTAEYIEGLRKALDAELQQAVEPFAWTGKGCGVMESATKNRMIGDAKHGGEFASAARVAESHDIPLYLHPPQPQATTPVPEGYVLVPIEPTPKMVDVTWYDNFVGMSDNSRNSSIYKAMVKAAQGEKT